MTDPAKRFTDAAYDLFETAKKGSENLVGKIRSLDAFYTGGEVESHVLDGLIVELMDSLITLEAPVLARLNFVSSLVATPVSPFFTALIQRMMDRAARLSHDQLIALVESCRRIYRYGSMEHYGQVLENNLVGRHPAVYKLRAKLSYERHMAKWQQSEKCKDNERIQLLNESMDLAEQSASEARQADDVIGRLFVESNIAGLLLLGLGKFPEALAISKRVEDEALSFKTELRDSDTRDRLYRVISNTLIQRLEIGMQLSLRTEIVEWLETLEKNPIYQVTKDIKVIKDTVSRAKAFVAGSHD